MDESKKKAPKKADPPYKKWAEEAKAFPKKHLKAPSPQQKKSKKKAPVTKKDIKKYAGNTGDVTQMEIEDKELRAKAKWGGMYRKVNHKSIMHKKEVKAKKEKKIVIHHYGKMEKKNKRGKKKAQAPPPPPPKANGESELKRKQAAKNDGKQGGNDVDKISRDSNHAAGNSALLLDDDASELMTVFLELQTTEKITKALCDQASSGATAMCQLQGKKSTLCKSAERTYARKCGVKKLKKAEKKVRSIKKKAGRKLSKKLQGVNARLAKKVKSLKAQKKVVISQKAKKKINRKIKKAKKRAARQTVRKVNRVKRRTDRKTVKKVSNVMKKAKAKAKVGSKSRIKHALHKRSKKLAKKVHRLRLRKRAARSARSKRRLARKLKRVQKRASSSISRKAKRTARKQIRKRKRGIKKKGNLTVKTLKIMKKLSGSKGRKAIKRKIAKVKASTKTKVKRKSKKIMHKAHKQVRKAGRKVRKHFKIPGKKKQIKAVAEIAAKHTAKKAVKHPAVKKHIKATVKKHLAKKHAKKKHNIIKKHSKKLAKQAIPNKKLKTLPGKNLSPSIHTKIMSKAGSKMDTAHGRQAGIGTYYHKTGKVSASTKSASMSSLKGAAEKEAAKAAGKNGTPGLKKFGRALAHKMAVAVAAKHAELSHKKAVAARLAKKPKKLRGPSQKDLNAAVKAAKSQAKSATRHGMKTFEEHEDAELAEAASLLPTKDPSQMFDLNP